MNSQSIIGMKVAATNTAWSVKLNDILIFADRWFESGEDTAIVNHWVLSGTNKIDINLHVPWNDDRKNDRKFQFEVLSIGADDNQVKLLEFNWEDSEDVEFPVRFEGNFELPNSMTTWAWEKGKTVNEEEIPLAEIQMAVAKVHAALSEKNVDAICALLETKAIEMGANYGIPGDERLAEQREFFEGLFQDQKWSMENLDWECMKVLIEADHRLMKVVDKNGKPFVRSVELDGMGVFGLPLYFYSTEAGLIIAR